MKQSMKSRSKLHLRNWRQKKRERSARIEKSNCIEFTKKNGNNLEPRDASENKRQTDSCRSSRNLGIGAGIKDGGARLLKELHSPPPTTLEFSRITPCKNWCSRRYSRIMAQSADTNTDKKLVRVDISSDTVCPWCFVGKKYLDKAISISKDQYNFELKWHPFQLDPTAPKEGIDKREYYRRKFGSRSEQMEARMSEVFKTIGLEYNLSGLTGNTLDSHRLIYFAGLQGVGKQRDLVEELCLGYFTQAKYIGDREFLLECASKAGIEGASEFLQDPNKGLKEVENELNTYSADITGVPYFVINETHKLSGAQPPEVFLRAFQVSTS
ncbi:hypothetical protein L6164_006631 [Bauhinia variegata]|uniref:Uncharacterized protein n=1 Tax=Bauhinia variegata TaxID=167791 RepID=A0ACB9PV30_BAUVA|nr:hypothetical protein L6164_006631 [Bauhinia variegata]